MRGRRRTSYEHCEGRWRWRELEKGRRDATRNRPDSNKHNGMPVKTFHVSRTGTPFGRRAGPASAIITFLCLCVVRYRRRPPCNGDHVSTSLSATLDHLAFAVRLLFCTGIHLAVLHLDSQRNGQSSRLVNPQWNMS